MTRMRTPVGMRARRPARATGTGGMVGWAAVALGGAVVLVLSCESAPPVHRAAKKDGAPAQAAPSKPDADAAHDTTSEIDPPIESTPAAAEPEAAAPTRKLDVVEAPQAPARKGDEYTPYGAHLNVPPEPPDQSPAEGDVLRFETPALAGISGLRDMWDRPIVLAADGKKKMVKRGRFGDAESAVWNEGGAGAIAFDAVHRSLLVRFPGSAEKIAAKLKSGARIEKAELVLPFEQTELWPIGYVDPAGMSFLGDKWAKSSPRWHAIAWVLRKPWVADRNAGPTYNQHAKGKRYWAKCGAADERKDRYPNVFGPAEVSAKYPNGRLDVTAALTSETFGASTADRLRAFEDNGLLVRKWEFYDAALWKGSYEWVTARGAQGIIVDTPKLEITFAKGAPENVSLPPPSNVAALTPSDEGEDNAARMVSAQEFPAVKEKYGFRKPSWMPGWQWQHVKQLKALGGGKGFPETYEKFVKWVDGIIGNLPRRWAGFDSSARAQEYLLYGDCWPEPARENMKLYWWAWLMPDRKISGLVQGYVGGKAAQAYYKRTRDWRGNFSVYRTYCHAMGTMNFNHWAAAGTLFGGAIIGNDFCISEGRIGLEKWPLRTWCWYDGTTQESIDHYYFAHSLAAQKAFADFGPTHLDRMMGMSILAKSVEELTSAFHPNLRRFISSSGRTGVCHVLAVQDGLSHILHTISKRGALTDADETKLAGGMPTFGHNYRPGQVALQTVTGPWAPQWCTAMLDDKPLPYEMVTGYKQWGGYRSTPLYRKSYLGEHYGLASLDVSIGNETVPVMAQWRRTPEQVESYADLSTLLMRPGLNRTELIDSVYHGTKKRNPNGCVGTQGSHLCSVQHENKIVCMTSPFKDLKYSGGRPVPKEVTSIQTTIGLFDYRDAPTWKLYVDGQPVTSFPHAMKMTSRITIDDGVTYVGLIPVPATDLGRDREVVISDDGVMTPAQGGGKTKEALRINAYLYRSDAPLAIKGTEQLDLAYGGFVIEMGDQKEYGSFRKFQSHVHDTKLDLSWNASEKTLAVSYESGDDTIEFGYKPGYAGGWNRRVPTTKVFPYRRANGEWPYLKKDMDRDTTLTQQGRGGRLEKNGAVLESQPGKMAYIQTEPASGTYVAFNPFPEPLFMKLTTPDGVVVEGDGKLGIARIAVSKNSGALWVDHAFLPKDEGRGGTATALYVTGLERAPAVVFNGKKLSKVERVTIDGTTAYVIPLVAKADVGDAARRLEGSRRAFAAFTGGGADVESTLVREWQIAGPFPNADGAGFDTAYPPEAKVDLNASYDGANGSKVSWKHHESDGGMIDLRKVVKPTDNVCAYAFTRVASDRARAVTLLAGSDDTITAWVNGERVLANKVYRGAEMDQERVRVELRGGDNELLLKICQGGGGWEFCARLADEFGVPLTDGISFDASRR